MRQITEIIVPCTATRPGQPAGRKEIDRWHRARGFRCIGYHYVVTPDGNVETGREEQETGAHCLGHNATSIGVVYSGGLDESGHPADTRTPAQRAALTALLRVLRARYPQARIRSHRDFAAKACPCFDATAEYASL